jgi:AraC-like DNA-binding protein
MKYQNHLFLEETYLAPSAEWSMAFDGWCFLRVAQGQGYWIGSEGVRELNTGDMLVLSPLRDGVLRASQLGPVQFQHFRFAPDLLGGVLTLAERRYLESVAAKMRPASVFLPADHPAAQEFSRVCARAKKSNGLLLRCRMLLIAAGAFSKKLSNLPPPDDAALTASKRILVLMNQLTEAEILSFAPGELAGRCGCSLRHFSRLFLANFGMSFRAKQTELRLLKARQLLSETDAKVMKVAEDSGYRHLGLFNAMFKKQFGVTPTEWRQQHRKPVRRKRDKTCAHGGCGVSWSSSASSPEHEL